MEKDDRRPMTGFVKTLSNDQRKAAADYAGPDTHGETQDPIFAEAERLYMLENPHGCLAANDLLVRNYWLRRAAKSIERKNRLPRRIARSIEFQTPLMSALIQGVAYVDGEGAALAGADSVIKQAAYLGAAFVFVVALRWITTLYKRGRAEAEDCYRTEQRMARAIGPKQ